MNQTVQNRICQCRITDQFMGGSSFCVDSPGNFSDNSSIFYLNRSNLLSWMEARYYTRSWLAISLEAGWSKSGYLNQTNVTLNVAADRGSLYPCPCCAKACPAHDFKALTWRHRNFFQQHCFITAQVPGTKCEEHGVHRVNVLRAREGSKFTLLFEQALLMLAREMPVKACAEYVGVSDKRIWRVIQHYVGRTLLEMDLSELKAIGLDETASKRGHNYYVTVFIDMDRSDKLVVFATPGKGKETVKQFKAFLEGHEGKAENILG